MKIYADASFLLALYSPDTNSPTAAQVMLTTNGDVLVSALTELEVFNAMRLRVFRRELSESQIEAALSAFENDLREGVLQLRPLPERVFERVAHLSRDLTPQQGTRAAELLHLAAAIELGANSLCSFDQQQLHLARQLGLKTN